jgi:hypothetical protein
MSSAVHIHTTREPWAVPVSDGIHNHTSECALSVELVVSDSVSLHIARDPWSLRVYDATSAHESSAILTVPLFVYSASIKHVSDDVMDIGGDFIHYGDVHIPLLVVSGEADLVIADPEVYDTWGNVTNPKISISAVATSGTVAIGSFSLPLICVSSSVNIVGDCVIPAITASGLGYSGAIGFADVTYQMLLVDGLATSENLCHSNIVFPTLSVSSTTEQYNVSYGGMDIPLVLCEAVCLTETRFDGGYVIPMMKVSSRTTQPAADTILRFSRNVCH